MKKIESDLYDIVDRLKEIDSRYRVGYNEIKGRYEVYTGEIESGRLAFVVPYDELDARTVEYAQATRKSRIDSIIEEIDRANERLTQSAINEAKQKAIERAIEGR